MMCKNKYLLLTLLVLAGNLIGCKQIDPVQKAISTSKSDIFFLASDSLKGRETGSETEKIAAQYIAKRFKEIGLAPKGDNGYFQDFSFSPPQNPHMQPSEKDSVKLNGVNVVGYIDNNKENTVIIGAHFDHLGYGEDGSLYRGEKQIHNGADDNASGVSAMLLLAENLKKRNTGNNYLFVAFSGEEKGLFGSNYFTKNPTIDLASVDYMINMDMVGRLDEENSLAINGVGTSPAWNQIIEDIGIDSLKLVSSESGVGPSDHTSFYLKDIPVLHFFTGQHKDYHKPSDDAELINYPGIVVVVAFIDSVITRLDSQPKLAFTKTKDESKDSPRFTVTLGVMPDYMFDGKGMRIDGVSEDKPAKKAGLEVGDVVTKLGDIDVTDMMSYMTALSNFKKGDKTIVTIKRGEEELSFPIQF